MTEAEWLACDDPVAMHDFLQANRGVNRRKNGRRRLRLFACACVRGLWPLLRQTGSRQALYYSERYADGQTTELDLKTATWRARGAIQAEESNPEGVSEAHVQAAQAAEHAVMKRYDKNNRLSIAHASLAASRAWALNEGELIQGESQQQRQAIHAIWLRDIFGNPFRPVAFSPEWRTSTAVALAGQMYESRDFGAMPILADALQDAGCDSEDMLSHCRDENATHVRGCWVVDLVLGKG